MTNHLQLPFLVIMKKKLSEDTSSLDDTSSFDSGIEFGTESKQQNSKTECAMDQSKTESSALFVERLSTLNQAEAW